MRKYMTGIDLVHVPQETSQNGLTCTGNRAVLVFVASGCCRPSEAPGKKLARASRASKHWLAKGSPAANTGARQRRVFGPTGFAHAGEEGPVQPPQAPAELAHFQYETGRRADHLCGRSRAPCIQVPLLERAATWWCVALPTLVPPSHCLSAGGRPPHPGEKASSIRNWEARHHIGSRS
jgi:hypothetical protein